MQTSCVDELRCLLYLAKLAELKSASSLGRGLTILVVPPRYARIPTPVATPVYKVFLIKPMVQLRSVGSIGKNNKDRKERDGGTAANKDSMNLGSCNCRGHPLDIK